MENTQTYFATAHDRALAFINKHADEHLSHDVGRLLNRTTSYLVQEYTIAIPTAHEVACQAWGEYESRNSPEYIDLSRTTQHCVFVRMRNDKSIALSTAELVKMITMKNVAAGEPT